ncbi:hypothetical protein ACA574_14475 [Lactiplantibacillus plantarum]|uniref:hypothetical protein n=1 Tax=Lactiplantibacillus plantarum TaxID=1590 RepID=UPI003C1D8EF6
METIATIAKRLGVSNGRIYQIIKDIPADKQPKKDAKGKYNFTKENISTIVEYYSHTGLTAPDPTGELIAQLKDNLDKANAELEAKNKQIDKFQTLLDQQQQLNLASNRLLETHSKDNSASEPEQEPKEDTKKPTKKTGFWGFLKG